MSDRTIKLRNHIAQEARSLGFDAVGFTSAHLPDQQREDLNAFTKAGFHGNMAWLTETLDRRSQPQTLWDGAKSIVMLAMNYGPEHDPLENLNEKQRGTISVYARHRDYHDVVKGRLKTLASKIIAKAGAGDVKVFVDTAPVMEKPLAQKAGLGWQGKHTNLVSREFGSWVFLGSIFTSLDLGEDEAEVDHCGSCTNCLTICPTQAFPAPYKIDARRCISYLTIENKGAIPSEFRKPMGNRIYGCDDCLAVCPWNKFAQTAQETKLASPKFPRDERLSYFLTLDDAAFRAEFSGSPVKRIGRDRFVRNCLIAAGNSEIVDLVPTVSTLLDDENSYVRGAAVWAIRMLVPDAQERYAEHQDRETDPSVLEEWKIPL